jgi:ABC-type dipeptide transport system, periplasmic component
MARLARYISLIAIILFLFACSKTKIPNGETVFRYNESAGISSLDPAMAKDQAMIWADNQLYNGLVQLDSSLNVQPCIAKSWNISSDGKTYTFYLRSDVYFHTSPLFKTPNHSRRVVAGDFVYSFGRIVDDKVLSPGKWIFNCVAKTNGKYAFCSLSDSVLQIKLTQPFAPFLSLLSMTYASVVPKEVVISYGKDFRSNPIGTGPFYFKMWKEGVKLVLLKNPHYFEKDANGTHLPYLSAVSISFIVDKQSVFLEFVKGNIDFMSGIDANYKDELLTHSGKLQPKYSDKVIMLTSPYLNVEYLGFYLDSKDKNNPLSNPKVRAAINYAFDRQKMIKYLRNNIGIAGQQGMIPPSLGGYDNQNIYTYDPQKAKQLLKEAGYPNGQGLPSITLSTTSSYLDLCRYIQEQEGLCGIKVKVDVNPPGALREQIAQGKSLWFRGSWIADYPDAENYLSLFYSKNLSPAGPNYTHFSSKAYDALYEKAIKETDINKRNAIYKQMNNLLMSSAPVVVLYYDQVLRFCQKNIHCLGTNAMNLLTLKYVKKD